MNGKTAKRWPQRLAGALCLLAVTLTAAANDNTLTVGVTENDAAPSMIFSYSPQPQLDGGVWKDLLDSIAHQLGQRVAYLPLARKRLDSYLQNGQIDMVCNTNPAWWEAPERFHWSLPLSEQVERFVSPLTLHERITSLSQLNGRRIGTVIGYHYPALAYAFAHGAQRIDQQQGNLQLRAAASGVVDVAVVDELSFAWWLKNNLREAHQVQLQPLVLSRMPLSCALSRRSHLAPASLNHAIRTLQQQGVLAARLKPYQVP